MWGCRQPGEDAAFAREAFSAVPGQGDLQELDRHAAVESTVAALGEPDGAHAAFTDRRDQRVGADGFACVRRSRPPGGAFEEAPAGELAVLGQEIASSEAMAGLRARSEDSQTARGSSPAIPSISSRYGLSVRQRSVGRHQRVSSMKSSEGFGAGRAAPSPTCA